MEDKIFKSDAKSIVDVAFNNKMFKDEITRDDMNAFQELIEFILSSQFNSYVKTKELMDSLDNKIPNQVFLVFSDGGGIHRCFKERSRAENYIGGSNYNIKEIKIA